MSPTDYALQRYFDLQALSNKITRLSDYAWGIDSALEYLLDALIAGTVPTDKRELDVTLDRVIASGGRLNRSRAATLRKSVTPSESFSSRPSAEKALELSELLNSVDGKDQLVLVDVGLGYTHAEIAVRQNSTVGAVSTRLSRLRSKLKVGVARTAGPAGRGEIVKVAAFSIPQPNTSGPQIAGL